MTPAERREAAIREHGETHAPRAAGFVLADGRWLDLGFGSGRRVDDHRIVGGLLLEGEIPDHATMGSATEAMNRWMDLAQAARVGIWEGPGGLQGVLHLPRRRSAALAVLTQGRSLAHLFWGLSEIEIIWRGEVHEEDHRTLGYRLARLRAIIEEAGEEP